METFDDRDVVRDSAPVTTINVNPSYDREFVVLVAHQAGDTLTRASRAQANLSGEKARALAAALIAAADEVED